MCEGDVNLKNSVHAKPSAFPPAFQQKSCFHKSSGNISIPNKSIFLGLIPLHQYTRSPLPRRRQSRNPEFFWQLPRSSPVRHAHRTLTIKLSLSYNDPTIAEPSSSKKNSRCSSSEPAGLCLTNRPNFINFPTQLTTIALHSNSVYPGRRLQKIGPHFYRQRRGEREADFAGSQFSNICSICNCFTGNIWNC